MNYIIRLFSYEEMLPMWFDIKEIPFDSMWADDRIWMPYFLENKIFKAYFLFSSDEKTVINYEIKEVESIN
jgi:hypothetical protein